MVSALRQALNILGVGPTYHVGLQALTPAKTAH